MSKEYKIFSALVSTLIILLIISTLFANSLKNKVLQTNLKSPINYEFVKLNNNFNKIIISESENFDEKFYFNKFTKDKFKTTTLLITTKDCNSDYIHLIARYNKNIYSDIYKLKPSFDQLYINIHNSKNSLNFLFFEIHKNNSNCIENIYQVLDKKIPYTYYIVSKEDNTKIVGKTKKYNFEKNGLNVLKKDKDLIIKENKIILHKNYSNDKDKNTNSNLLDKYYYNNVLKSHHLVKDVFYADIDTKKIKNLVVKCKIIIGNVNFLIFDSENFEIIDFQKCVNKKENLLIFPPRNNLKLLISTLTTGRNTYENNFSVNFYYF